MNEKFNNNAKFEQLIKILLSCEEEIGLIVKGPFSNGSAVDELDNHVYSIVTQLHAAFTTFTPPADHNKVLWYCRMISVFDLHDFTLLWPWLVKYVYKFLCWKYLGCPHWHILHQLFLRSVTSLNIWPSFHNKVYLQSSWLQLSSKWII